VIAEVKNRKPALKGGVPRILIWGSILDDVSVVEAIESCGCNVVVDDT